MIRTISSLASLDMTWSVHQDLPEYVKEDFVASGSFSYVLVAWKLGQLLLIDRAESCSFFSPRAFVRGEEEVSATAWPGLQLCLAISSLSPPTPFFRLNSVLAPAQVGQWEKPSEGHPTFSFSFIFC